jgi:hypothetical protein
MFKKNPQQPTERLRRPVQQSPQRSAVFSYHANRTPRTGASVRDIQQVEKPIRTRPKRDWLRQMPLIGIAVLTLAVVMLNMQLGTAVTVRFTGDTKSQVFLRDKSDYESAAQAAFTGIMNRNKLTVNTEQVVNRLTKQFPEIDAVSVSLPLLGNRPTIYIQPATPTLILATSDNGVYILDRDGRALIRGAQIASLRALRVPVVTDQSGLPITIGKVALPRDTVAFIDDVAYQLGHKGIAIESLLLPAGTNELQLRVKGAGYYAKFNVYGNAREEAGAFIALTKRLSDSHITPKEYVDVRVEGRVYYR